MTIVETKKRTTFKAITWRIVAVINSWAILTASLSQSNFTNAILMNITGFFAFYFFERIWSKINYGRYHLPMEKE
jgi:uncharacterized membrane protein